MIVTLPSFLLMISVAGINLYKKCRVETAVQELHSLHGARTAASSKDNAIHQAGPGLRFLRLAARPISPKPANIIA